MSTNQPNSTLIAPKTIIGVLVLVVFVAAYAALSLLTLYKPDFFPARSFTAHVMHGPPSLLVSGRGDNPLYWICTATIVCALAVAAKFSRLQPAAVVVIGTVWAGAGFFTVLMSV